jgi:hypothetical protein
MEIALRHETAEAIQVRACTGAAATAAPTQETPEMVEAAR